MTKKNERKLQGRVRHYKEESDKGLEISKEYKQLDNIFVLIWEILPLLDICRH